jgi:hypothetical protein
MLLGVDDDQGALFFGVQKINWVLSAIEHARTGKGRPGSVTIQ